MSVAPVAEAPQLSHLLVRLGAGAFDRQLERIVDPDVGSKARQDARSLVGSKS